MIKSIIVEDELMARKSLRRFCEKIEEIDIVEEFENGESALEYLSESQVDLIFLDIEMPGCSGLELLESLPVLPQIIFTTSNKEYAFEAFEYDVTDFLKKPISFARLQTAIEKAKKIAIALDGNSDAGDVYVKDKGKLIRLQYEDIFYIENAGDYAKVNTGSKNYIVHGTIKGFEKKLPSNLFVRVHRSYIINLNKIVDIEENSVVIDKKVVPISRAQKPILMERIKML